jgi:RimJ/RimL family protein N-acetyltransferase
LISFSELHSDHFSLMYDWFNKPHVQIFYSLRNWTKEEVFQKLLPYIAFDKGVHGFVTAADKHLIGYIQYYPIALHSWPEQDLPQHIINTAAGVDLFIGEESYIGQGWGTEIMNVFCQTVLSKKYRYCVVDPDVRNLASLRMFAKCGFCPHKTVNSRDALGNEVKLQLMLKLLA